MIQWHTGAKRVETLAFSPDGGLLASVTRQAVAVKLWRPDGQPDGRVSVGAVVRVVSFHPDGRSLVVGHDAGVAVYDPTGAGPQVRLTAVDGYFGRAVAVRPDGAAVAAVVGVRLRWWPWPTSWRPLFGADYRELPADRLNFSTSPSLAFAPDGRLVANWGDAARVWADGPDQPPRTVPHPPCGTVRSHVCVSAAGQVAASHGRDISVSPLDGDGPSVVLPGAAKCPSVRGMGFLSDGSLLAVAADGFARLWDADTGTERTVWDFGMKNLQSLAVSPDGLTAAAGSHAGRSPGSVTSAAAPWPARTGRCPASG